jgi:hypothetical protein
MAAERVSHLKSKRMAYILTVHSGQIIDIY